jgi:hypothetical protein
VAKDAENQAKEARIPDRPICSRYAVHRISLAIGDAYTSVFIPYVIADLMGIDEANPK